MPKFVLLWTDASIWLLVVALLAYGVMVLRNPALSANWRKVFHDAAAMCSAIVLLLCLLVTLLDSVHYRRLLPPVEGQTSTGPAYETRTRSLLDGMLWQLVESRESTYSRPLSYVSFTKESVEQGGQLVRVAPRLKFGGSHLQQPETQWLPDVLQRAVTGLAAGAACAAVLCGLLLLALARSRSVPVRVAAGQIWRGEGNMPWHAALWTIWVAALAIGVASALAGPYHLLGTDLTGNDVLYQALKSIRTAFVIGTLATVATLPLAVVLGIMAGYFKGWVDEVIQYIYTVLSSVPNVLLIAACVLMVQVFLDKHPELFETGAERSDLKLFLLCMVLGLTGWAGLCRLLRAETLKLRELDYVQAAQAFGVPDARIMRRHIFPNVAHLM
ncbi:MAG: hypothetical protein RL375_4884, partial [Pseudomonadota bacterium]